MTTKFSNIFSQLGFGIALGVATILCTGIAATTYLKVKASQNSIQVKGYAEKKIISENAVWSGSINASHPHMAEAYEALDRIREKTMALLKKEGYSSDLVVLGSVTKHQINKLTPDGKNTTNEIESYNLSQTLEISSEDVKKLSIIPSKLNELNIAGYDINSGHVQFYYPSDKLDKLKVDLLAKASKSARERAEQFAVNSDCKVGKLLSARQGVFQITAANSSDISDSGTYDTSTIEKIVKIVVTMTYGIE